MTPIFYLKDAKLSFADKIILESLELYISPGDKICLVGKNGCGKSSLLKIITEEYELDSGKLFQDPGITVTYLPQDLPATSSKTIYEFVLAGFNNPDEHKYQADMLLNGLNIDGNLDIANCSGGQKKRACLIKALINQPDILLLDEPTNHLDITAIKWLEEYLKHYPGAVICISHDRTFQEYISNRVWWLDRGVLRISKQGFKHYDQWREEIIQGEEAVLRKMNRQLEAEKGWLNTGVTARRKRNQKRLANLHRLREEYKSQQTHLQQAKQRLQIEMQQEVKKNKFIIEATELSYQIQNKYLFKDFSIQIKKGEKIGLIGPNGCGKSTLIKILIKSLEPETGRVKVGDKIDITYFDQHRTSLRSDLSIKQNICPTGGDHIFLANRNMHVAAYLKKFMFDPKLLNDKVSTLSGGQANRLLLAKMLINPGNFLILDEPTNDLDMDTLEMLLEILADYQGTLLIVSHDRDFLENLVTRTLVFTGEAEIIDLYGGYKDYLAYHQQNLVEKPLAKKPKAASANDHLNANKSSNGKLSYKYLRLLEVLPEEISQLEAEISIIEAQLANANLYQDNTELFYQLTTKLPLKKQELDAKLQQWIEIDNMS